MTVLTLCLFTPFTSLALYDFNRNCQEAMQAILDLRLKDAEAMIAAEKRDNPDNGYRVYLEHYAEAITLILTEDEAVYQRMMDRLPGRLKQLDDMDDGSPDKGWLQAEMLFHAGLAQVRFGTRVNGVSKLFSAYKKTREHRKKFPGFFQTQKLTGIYNILLDNLPPFLSWAADIFGYAGDSGIGVYQLKEYTKKAMFIPGLAEEALLIGSLGCKMAGEEAEGLRLFTSADPQVLENTLVRYQYANMASFNYRNDISLKLLGGIDREALQVRFFGLDYLAGRCKLNHLEMDARVYFERYLKSYPGEDYKKDVCNRLSYCYLLMGDPEKYAHYRDLVPQVGQTLRDRDQEAELESQAGLTPHTGLLRARLLCDGGYVVSAMKVMDSIQPGRLEQVGYRLEYYYRLGRIHQLRGNTGEAISNLTKAYIDGKSEPFTYATRAAYQLARIHEDRKEYRLAYEWYLNSSAVYSTEHTAESVKTAAGKGAKRVKGKV